MARVLIDNIEFQFDPATWTICNDNNEILENVVEKTVETLCSKLFYEKKNSNKLQLPKYAKIKKCDNFLCSICLEHSSIGIFKRVLPCSHVFHKKCVDKWIKKHDTCPICRKVPYVSITEVPDRTYNLTPDRL